MPSINKKHLVVAAFLLISLPVIIFASKKSQEIRSHASELPSANTETTASIDDATNYEDAGNSALSSGLESTSVSTPQNTTQNQATADTSPMPTQPPIAANHLTKQLYGFLPSWEINSSTDTYLQYNLLSTLAYFDITLNTDGSILHNGGYSMWQNPQPLNKIYSNARQAGVKTVITITLFNSNGGSQIADLLNNAQSKQNAIKNIVNLMSNSPRPVDGVNIDFEFVPTSQKSNFTNFIKDLRSEMNKHNTAWTLVIDTRAYDARDANSSMDWTNLSKYTDAYFIMSYNLHPKGNKVAGTEIPYNSLSNVIDDYLKVVPANKIIPGISLQSNIAWATKDSTIHSNKVNASIGKTYGMVYQKIYQTAPAYPTLRDNRDKTAWFEFLKCGGNAWQQVYFDDTQSFGDKMDLIKQKGAGGLGAWALNSNQGYLYFWQAVYNKFADQTANHPPIQKPGFTTPPVATDNSCQTPTPTPTTTQNPTQTPVPTAAPTPVSSNSTLSFSVTLPGIGAGGNATPKKTSLALTVEVFGANGVKIDQVTKELNYDQTSGKYNGQIPVFVPTPNPYSLYFLSDSYLTVRQDLQLSPGITTAIAPFTFSGGDLNNDGERNLLDWNLLLACSLFTSNRNTSLCPNGSSQMQNADLDSNGVVDQDDITLWIDEFKQGPQ